MVGTACWSSVRPATTVSRCVVRELGACPGDRVEVVHDQVERAARDERGRGVEHVLARRAAMDMVGRVAADRLAQRPDERLGRVAGAPAAPPELPRGRSASASHAAAIASAASAGITPARASARASARSASSIAASQARPETASRTASGTKSGANSSSEGKEDRLPLSLQPDVEAELAVARRLGDERRAPFRAQTRQDGVGRVRLGLVREVDARQRRA